MSRRSNRDRDAVLSGGPSGAPSPFPVFEVWHDRFVLRMRSWSGPFGRECAMAYLAECGRRNVAEAAAGQVTWRYRLLEDGREIAVSVAVAVPEPTRRLEALVIFGGAR